MAWDANTHPTRSSVSRQPFLMVWDLKEREMGFEPTTTTLATWRSTPELLPRDREQPPEDSTQTPSRPTSRVAEAKPSIRAGMRISSRLPRIRTAGGAPRETI